MKPHLHAESSVNKFGGKPEDYIKIHEWFDQTKAHMPDQRHRAILHSSFGIFLCEQVFGSTITNSDNKVVSVRDIGEQHVLEDFGGKFIPTVQDWLSELELQDWMRNGNGFPPSYVKTKLLAPSSPALIKFEDVMIDGSRPFVRPLPFDDVPLPPVFPHLITD